MQCYMFSFCLFFLLMYFVDIFFFADVFCGYLITCIWISLKKKNSIESWFCLVSAGFLFVVCYWELNVILYIYWHTRRKWKWLHVTDFSDDPNLQLKISSLKFKRFASSFHVLERQLRYLGCSSHWNDCCFSLSIFSSLLSYFKTFCRYVST